jgi:hypothetical protein
MRQWFNRLVPLSSGTRRGLLSRYGHSIFTRWRQRQRPRLLKGGDMSSIQILNQQLSLIEQISALSFVAAIASVIASATKPACASRYAHVWVGTGMCDAMKRHNTGPDRRPWTRT